MKRLYPAPPTDPEVFTSRFDRWYSRIAVAYDWFIRVLPVWKKWLNKALPFIEGERVLEVSFGTGYLLTQYASNHETHGIDFNADMVKMAQEKLASGGIYANLKQASVEDLPYEDESFDCLVNTMAWSSYPNGRTALLEMLRILKPGGRIVMIDIDYPADMNFLGTLATRLWISTGDVIRDMHKVFNSFGLEYEDKEIGGWGSVHLYILRKQRHLMNPTQQQAQADLEESARQGGTPRRRFERAPET